MSRAPVLVPAVLDARRVTGVGDVAGGILADLRVQGVVRVTPERAWADNLILTSRNLRGLVDAEVDLRTGVYAVVLNGGMRTYVIPGFGVVDVLTELRAVPGPGGKGTAVTGTARAWVRRLDNRFLSWVSGGLPRLDTNLTRGPDKIVHFTNLRITAPHLTLGGTGLRRTDGTFQFEGGGRHSDYGPLRLTLDGRLERPRLAVRLERPLDALGLRNVLLNIDPNEAGFAWRGEGGSALGPFTGNGQILLPRGQPATIRFAELNVSGARASGALRSDPGGFNGTLDVAGGGLDGRLRFSPANGHQRIAVELTASDAHFVGPPPIVVRRGTISGVILLDPAGTSIEGRVVARGVSRGPLSIANIDASASLRGGTGILRARVAGSRGRDFAFNAVIEVAPNRYRVSGSGTLDRRPLELVTPAALSWSEEGWRLAPTRFRFAGGNASLAGLFGARTEVDARLEAMPLTIMDIFYPELGLGGIASGTVRYSSPSAEAPPSGEMNLRVRGLTRAGLVLTSRPVDIGVNARLQGSNAAFRAIAASEGRTIGRAQGRMTGITGPGSLGERLARAPMRAQVRYNGAADTLWRLTGIELLDLSGPAAIGADISGSFNNPMINGSVRTAGARLESAVTGMVIDNLESVGQFGGSELRITSFRGRTEGGGTISGSGTLDFSVARGVGMRLDLNADNARLLDRDDIQAAVTGPLAIRSDGDGGTISGNVTMTQGRFQLGSATAAAQVPRLNAREINRPDAELGPVVRRIAPWRLALDVRAPSRLTVTGLGMNSEWSANLRRRRHGDRAADHRRGRPDPGHLRFRRAALRSDPRQYPLRRRGAGQSAARHRRRGAGARPFGADPRHRAQPAARNRLHLDARAAAGRIALAHPLRHLDHQSLGARGGAARRRRRQPQRSARRARPDQRGAPHDRPRSAAHPPRRRDPGDRHPARRRQIFRPPRLCGGGDRRPRLFGDHGRISDHPLALAAVFDLDDRPRKRQRARLAGLLRGRG